MEGIYSKTFWLEVCAKSTRRNEIQKYSFGNALWSPQGGRYKNMIIAKPGDIVLHLNKDSKKIEGASIIAEKADNDFVCLDGTEWEGRKEYFII